MGNDVETALARWVASGVIDPAAAERIRAFESARDKRGGLRWPVVVALVFGALMLAAGVLLFVSAQWEGLAPWARFATVLLLVAVFHVVGALSDRRFPYAASTFHALGTAALGAGVLLTGQIFNMDEHWPAGMMIWAAGAWIGWAILRDWPQATLAAVLTPVWLSCEWIDATRRLDHHGVDVLLGQWLIFLALVYLGAKTRDVAGPIRRALAWCGGFALIPAVAMLWFAGGPRAEYAWPMRYGVVGWVGGLGLPLLFGWLLRHKAAWVLVGWAAWVAILGFLVEGSRHFFPLLDAPAGYQHEAAVDVIGQYFWLLAGCVAMVAWGVHERRGERVNLGFVCFALVLLAFYFSDWMDRVGRASGLIGLGIVFLGGGWLLERMRRRLIARIATRGSE